MTRSNARELAVHFVFEQSFAGTTAAQVLAEGLNRQTFERIGQEETLYSQFPNVDQRAYITTLAQGVEEHRMELENYISKYSVGWKLNRLPRMAVAILEVCMYEILYMGDVPNAAAINEAVELTKKYEDEEIAGFVNGILGTFVRTEAEPQTESLKEDGVFDDVDVTRTEPAGEETGEEEP